MKIFTLNYKKFILIVVTFLLSFTSYASITFSGSNRIELYSSSTVLYIASDIDVNVTIYSDVSFITLDGSTNVITSIQANHSIPLRINVNRSVLSNDYYIANIYVNYGNQTISHPIFIQSGLDFVGYTYWRSHFHEIETGRRLRYIDPAFTEQFESTIVEMDGENVLKVQSTERSKYWWLQCNAQGDISDNYNYKISFKAYLSAENLNCWLPFTIITDNTQIFTVYLYASDNIEKGIQFFYDDQSNRLVDKTANFDEWFDVSFTFNFNHYDSRLVCATFKGVTTNINIRINAPANDKDYFNSLQFYSDSPISLYFKDFLIEAEPICLNVEQPEHGIIEINPQKNIYERNDIVTINAIPDEGYKLVSLYCDDFQTTNLVSTYNVTHGTYVKGIFKKVKNHPSILFSEDFEDYDVGTEMVGTVDGWIGDGPSTVFLDDNNHVMKLFNKKSEDSYESYSIKTPSFFVKGNSPIRELTKISFRIKDGINFITLRNYGDNTSVLGISINHIYGSAMFYMYESSIDVEFRNLNSDIYYDIYLIYDPLFKKIIEIGLNGEIQHCDIPLSVLADKAYLGLQETGRSCYIDDILIEIIPRSTTPVIFCSELEYIKEGNNQIYTTIYNGGPAAEINYTISSDADWLSAVPSRGTYTENADICFQINSNMPWGCYEANVVFDGGEYGTATMKLIWQNGYIYQSYFDCMQLGDILSQDKRWYIDRFRGREFETYDIVNDGCGLNEHCLQINQIQVEGGLSLIFANIIPDTNIRYRVSFDFKTDESLDYDNHFYFGYVNGSEVFHFYCNPSKMVLRQVGKSSSTPKGDYIVCDGDYIGQWVHISYTMSYGVFNPSKGTQYRFMELQLNDRIVTNNNFVSKSGNNIGLDFSCRNNHNFYVDNISCEIIHEEVGVDYADSIGGRLIISPQKDKYFKRDVITVTAEPNPGYELLRVYCDDFSSTNLINNYTLTHPVFFLADFIPKKYKLSIDSTSGGSVFINPQKLDYDFNEVVTITAVPDSGHDFLCFTGTIYSTNQVVSINMDQHHYLIAKFKSEHNRLNLNVGDHGRVIVSPEKDYYSYNEKVTLVATPDEGYAFSGFTGDVCSTNSTIEIIMDKDYDIGADFYFDAYRLNIEANEGGYVKVIPEKEIYHLNEKVTIIAIPNEGYAFDNYSGTVSSNDPYLELTVNQNYDINVNFYFNAYRLILNVEQGGRVIISPEKDTYNLNETVTLTAVPEDGYVFSGFNGTESSTNMTMLVTMNKHQEINAFFFYAYHLNVTSKIGGTVIIYPEKMNYHFDDKVTITAIPDNEYAFRGYSGTASSTNLVMEITMDQHHDIVADFYFDAYRIDLIVGEHGKVVVVPPKETYNLNEKVTLTAIPDAEYAFAEFTGTESTTNSVLEIVMDKHYEIEANFYFDAYRLQVNAVNGGNVNYEPVKNTYHNEDEVTITATPEIGYGFANYSGTLETTENPLVIKMTQHHEIQAHFTNLEYLVTCERVDGGSVTFTPAHSSYHYNEEITYTVEPDKGYYFFEIQGYRDVLTNLVGTIIVTEALVLTPVFKLDEYKVTLTSTFGGTIALEPKQETYHYNDVVKVKNTPDEGYVLSKLSANGETLDDCDYVINGDTEINAVFIYDDKNPEGEGTESSPYKIESVANLVWLARNVNILQGSYSALNAEIDLDICSDWMNGLGFEPIGSEETPFQGSFDGKNFTIKGLYINNPNLEIAGLFGYVKKGKIKNVIISNANVTASKNVGLLAGTLESSEIKNVNISGRAKADVSAGLLAGYVNHTSAELICVEGDVESNDKAGGLIGEAKDCNLVNSYTIANVSAKNFAGGFIGKANYTSISNGYVAGYTNGDDFEGGVYGSATESAAISVFFDKANSRDNGYGQGVKFSDLLSKSTFSDWDFENVWDIDDGESMPYFRWQIPEPFALIFIILLIFLKKCEL